MRVARAAVFALLAVLLAAGAHASGGGRVPALGTVLLLWLAVLPVAAVLARRTWGPGALTTALGLLELGLHQALSLGTAGAPATAGAAHATGHGGVMTAHVAHGAGPHGDGHASHASATDVASAAGPDHHTGLPMLLGHVVATVLTALVLAHGDALLARLWAWATLRDLPRAGAPTLADRVAPSPGWQLDAGQPPLVAAGGVCRRGPPQG
ncbi:hypothetical protein CCE01nite_16420 [Cellulomonas cellasea]|uniref:Integral membrane protein n=1 Tax=Cellulomonas cellasea TaxID=43670 RepID=A0A4Y3KUJ9_9CELL|nr:hypothetical protein CCE01nite_16420 [Cellulomonas cellasea]